MKSLSIGDLMEQSSELRGDWLPVCSGSQQQREEQSLLNLKGAHYLCPQGLMRWTPWLSPGVEEELV